MEQLRHRLTNVSPQGQRCSADQNPLKRTDLDDLVNCYFGGTSSVSSGDLQKQVPPGNRHERKESERFKSSLTTSYSSAIRNAAIGEAGLGKPGRCFASVTANSNSTSSGSKGKAPKTAP